MSEHSASGPGPVVAGFDGSDQGWDALHLATILSRAVGSPLWAADVYPHDRWEVPPLGYAEWSEFLREDATRTLEEAEGAERVAGADLVTRAVPSSSPARGLQDLASRCGASLIVIGSSHRGTVGRVMNGSVGERLLHGSPSPVAVAPLGYRDADERSFGYVAAGYDGGPEAGIALEQAIRLARALDVRLRVIGVAEPSHLSYRDLDITRPSSELQEEVAEETRRKLGDAMDAVPGEVDAEPVLLEGDPGELLAREGRQAGILVIGSRGYGPLRRVLLGGISSTLMRSAPCPVLVCPRGLGSARL